MNRLASFNLNQCSSGFLCLLWPWHFCRMLGQFCTLYVNLDLCVFFPSRLDSVLALLIGIPQKRFWVSAHHIGRHLALIRPTVGGFTLVCRSRWYCPCSFIKLYFPLCNECLSRRYFETVWLSYFSSTFTHCFWHPFMTPDQLWGSLNGDFLILPLLKYSDCAAEWRFRPHVCRWSHEIRMELKNSYRLVMS